MKEKMKLIGIFTLIYLITGWGFCGSYTRESWIKCEREVPASEQIAMITLWAPAIIYVVILAPFDKQPEDSCFNK